MLERIERVLDEKVRPQLALHGGDIRSVSFRDGVYRFRLSGQCAGCPSAYLTTENLIREEVQAALPQVRDVVLEQGVSAELLDQARALMGRPWAAPQRRGYPGGHRSADEKINEEGVIQ